MSELRGEAPAFGAFVVWSEGMGLRDDAMLLERLTNDGAYRGTVTFGKGKDGGSRAT